MDTRILNTQSVIGNAMFKKMQWSRRDLGDINLEHIRFGRYVFLHAEWEPIYIKSYKFMILSKMEEIITLAPFEGITANNLICHKKLLVILKYKQNLIFFAF